MPWLAKIGSNYVGVVGPFGNREPVLPARFSSALSLQTAEQPSNQWSANQCSRLEMQSPEGQFPYLLQFGCDAERARIPEGERALRVDF